MYGLLSHIYGHPKRALIKRAKMRVYAGFRNSVCVCKHEKYLHLGRPPCMMAIKITWRRFQVRSLVVAFLLLSCSHCSPTTELLKTITRLLTDCSRFYPHADRNVAENLIVRLEVAVDSVRRLVDSLDRCDQANDERIPHLESLVRQLQILLNRWEMFAIRAVSCTSLRPIRALPGVSATPNPRVSHPAYEISIPQLKFLRNRMRFNCSQIIR